VPAILISTATQKTTIKQAATAAAAKMQKMLVMMTRQNRTITLHSAPVATGAVPVKPNAMVENLVGIVLPST